LDFTTRTLVSDFKFDRNGLEDGIPVDEFGFGSLQEDVSDDLSPLNRRSAILMSVWIVALLRRVI